jgi:hypothetical protein
MQLNSFQFPDRSRIETFSQKQQQIIVNQQTPAIPANQVTGTTGQPFVAISPQSMVVSTNGATDLVGGQIQMAMSQQILQTVAVQPDIRCYAFARQADLDDSRDYAKYKQHRHDCTHGQAEPARRRVHDCWTSDCRS